MVFKILIKVISVSFIFLFLLTACEKEFNDVGSAILDEDSYDLKDTIITVAVSTELTGAVETSNLPINSLGVYNDPLFGLIDNSFVTQLELAEVNPTIGLKPKVTNVVLSIPYFSTLTSRDADGKGIYDTDSIYGNSKIKLSVYESGYYMKGFDSESVDQVQKFYSNGEDVFLKNIRSGVLNNSNTDFSQNIDFLTNRNEIEVIDPVSKTVIERLSPRMYLNLDSIFFEKKILNAPSENLFNNDVFKEYFRGLFFKAEAINPLKSNEGTLMQLDFSKGQIKITYTEGEDNARVEKTMYLNLKGNTANFFNNSSIPKKENSIVLKGGAGAIATLELFKKELDFDLEKFKAKMRYEKWLITDANLVLNIDEEEMQKTNNEPSRLYLYNAFNSTSLIDYSTDFTTASYFKKNKHIFDGMIQLNENKKGKKYAFKITKHINNIMTKDSANVKLGLSITENINSSLFSTNKLKSKKVLYSNTVSPFGTILKGNTSTDNKQVKLEIFYSTPKK